MVRSKKAKTAALVLTAVCMFLSLFVSTVGLDLSAIGVCKGCSTLVRLAYSFFHASILHAIVNCWCLLSVVFVYDVCMWHLLSAYLIAVTYPANTLFSVGSGFVAASAATPTIGLSAVCFALLGMIAFQVKRKLLFHSWVLSFVAAGFIIPHLCSLCGINVASPNNVLHIYCYVAGLMVGFLNSPAHGKK